MNVTPRQRRDPHCAAADVTTALAAALQVQGCTPAAVARAQTLWHEFLATAAVSRLPGSPDSWCAALHYLVAPLSGRTLTQRAVSTRYHTAPSTLSSRVKVITTHTAQVTLAVPCPATSTKTAKRLDTSGGTRKVKPTAAMVFSTVRHLAPPTAPAALDDEGWIAVFQATHRLLSRLYGQKTHVEILHYLTHVELNLALAGYRIGRQVIVDRFRHLFTRLGLQAAKGRDARKFVYLQDVFGMQEPFALLKLEYEDG